MSRSGDDMVIVSANGHSYAWFGPLRSDTSVRVDGKRWVTFQSLMSQTNGMIADVLADAGATL